MVPIRIAADARRIPFRGTSTSPTVSKAFDRNSITCFSNRSNNLLLLVNSMIISNVQQFRRGVICSFRGNANVVDGRCDTDKGHAENAVWPLLRRRHGTGSPIGLVTDRWSRLVPPDTAENMGRDGPRFRLHLSFPRPLN